MAKYKCNICRINIVESPGPPDFCELDGTTNGPWINLETGVIEDAKGRIFGKAQQLGGTKKKWSKKRPGFLTKIRASIIRRLRRIANQITGIISVWRSKLTKRFAFKNIIREAFSLLIISISNIYRRWKISLIVTTVLLIFTLGKLLFIPYWAYLLIIPVFLFMLSIFLLFGSGKKTKNNASLIISGLMIIGMMAFPVREFMHFAKNNISGRWKELHSGDDLDIPDSAYLLKQVNLRSGPGMSYRIICVMHPPNKIKFTESTEGSWQKIRYLEKTGWFYKDPSFFSMSNKEIICRAVPGEGYVNMREGPSAERPVIKTIQRGESLVFVKTNEDGSWVNIKDRSGNKGWIWKPLIAFEVY